MSHEPFSLPIELQKSKDFWHLVEQQLQGVVVPSSTLAKRVGIAFLYLSLEHLYAIITLIHDRQFASAFSLMRPQYEAAIRGAWFSFSASEEQARSLLDDDALPRIQSQITELIATRPDLEGLDAIHAASWGWLNDYTHGGSTLIKSRFQEGRIDCAITETHAATNLAQVRRFGLMVAVWFGEVAGRNDLCDSFYKHLLQHDRA